MSWNVLLTKTDRVRHMCETSSGDHESLEELEAVSDRADVAWSSGACHDGKSDTQRSPIISSTGAVALKRVCAHLIVISACATCRTELRRHL